MLTMQMIGHIGRAPELKDIKGKKVITFSLAHTDKTKNGDFTTWVKCSMWNNEKIFEYLHKGDKVYVAGIPSANAWKNNEGNAVADLQMIVKEIELLTKK